MTHLPPGDRDIAMVFQDYALYPHLSAADNIGFALRLARTARMPAGGERQRVATGRLLVRDARVHLLDELLSHLDARLRAP